MENEKATTKSDEGFCNTAALRVSIKTVYGMAAAGALVFGGAAFAIGGFAPPSPLIGVLWFLAGFICVVPLLVALVILHEATHWVAFRAFGAREARFMWVMRNGKPIAPSVCGPGKWLKRWQYVTVIVSPTLLVSAVGLLLMLAVPVLRGALALALTLHLTGCVNDWYVARATFALARGTEIEDRESGFAYRTANPAG